MKRLAFCLLVQNDKESIKDCVESIEGLDSDILFISKSDDGSDDILKKYGGKELNKKFCKNSFLDLNYEFYFFIETNEMIINGPGEIKDLLNKKDVYSVLLLNNGVLARATRFFSSNFNLKFENPIFETVFFDNPKSTNIVLKTLIEKDFHNEYERIVDWKKSDPFNPMPLYYECCYYLKNNKIDDFITQTEKYFFLENKKDLPSYVMLKYYLSYILFYHKKDIKNAMLNLIFCIEKNPTLAEFWCLLGDINFEIKKYKKAYYFYENAMILGRNRCNEDFFPIEIRKYSTYPELMKTKCSELINNV
jgi:hypothetical protein